MDISQLKKKKEKLDAEITRLINVFEKETNCNVSDVHMNMIDISQIDKVERTFMKTVTTTVTL